uniref:YceG-like family protein n=1 Tax=Myoviridae sp. cte0t5 TaxID=2823549 RepID=A0A8S5LGT5_9CAUD|nr:MAG TPA: YceG-like family protein [Myoviridae sp. cte0t5]
MAGTTLRSQGSPRFPAGPICAPRPYARILSS